MFKYCLDSYVLFFHIACYIWKQPLKGGPWNMCSLKLGKPDTLNKDMNTL